MFELFKAKKALKKHLAAPSEENQRTLHTKISKLDSKQINQLFLNTTIDSDGLFHGAIRTSRESVESLIDLCELYCPQSFHEMILSRQGGEQRSALHSALIYQPELLDLILDAILELCPEHLENILLHPDQKNRHVFLSATLYNQTKNGCSQQIISLLQKTHQHCPSILKNLLFDHDHLGKTAWITGVSSTYTLLDTIITQYWQILPLYIQTIAKKYPNSLKTHLTTNNTRTTTHWLRPKNLVQEPSDVY